MTIATLTKPMPTSIAVFGSSGRWGRSVVDYLSYAAPDIRLRLLTSTPAACGELQRAFPRAEVKTADYLNAQSMRRALDGIEGIFVVTPPGLDEHKGMTNLVKACRISGSVIHIVRITAIEPGKPLKRVPADMVAANGDASQHYIAKEVLEDSELPVTYLNGGATMMCNLLLSAPTIRAERTLVWPDRYICQMDIRDFGEVAARLLLSDDARHIDQFHTVNNGQDQLTTAEVVQMMSDVWRVRIHHDPSKEGFMRQYGAALDTRYGEAAGAEYHWRYLEMESLNNIVWSLNNLSERILGRKPNTLRSWLQEHRSVFLG